MKISPARVAAFEVLVRIETERAFSSVLLPEFERGLDERDRRLCHQLTLGVLRQQIYLDRVIDHLATGKKIDTAIRVILRLALFQLTSLDKIPHHSAVNESVLLTQKAKKSSAKGFVNALLRRYLREGFQASYKDELERISVETSHPPWLIERWAASFGAEDAEKFAASNNEVPAVAFRYTGSITKQLEIDAFESDLVPGCFITERYSPALIEAAENGEIYLQDEGSQMVGSTIELLGAKTFLDVCAAPGSKATQIAAKALGTKALIVAGEFHSHRTRFLLENCRKQELDRVTVIQYDAETSLPFQDRSFDAVLVDAPCSGTGTIRHNPEIRYFLSPGDIDELSAKQRRILLNASKMVKDGGSLVYSTCSVESEENESVVEVLDSDTSFKRIRPSIAERFLAASDFGRTYPNQSRMDGFFIAKYERTGGN
jgi:16S rRNA (cytosine967-C5)-methyltransferase